MNSPLPPSASKAVCSTQSGIHRDLGANVVKHLSSKFLRTPADHTKIAFATVNEWLADRPAGILLDCGCGTGESSIQLALDNPSKVVIGVDKSDHRLTRIKKRSVPKNCLLLRAELIDIWQLIRADNWAVEKQYLLYPNPWPKPKHLQRRWHGHSIFPAILESALNTELRTNWEIYALEFAQAVEIISEKTGQRYEVCAGNFLPSTSLTPFERKYLASGHDLYQVTVTRSR